MKKLTQKLVLSVITMALVVVALGTSTFAWFTLQNTASLEQFSGQVTAGEGMEVSLGTWTPHTSAAAADGTISLSNTTDWYNIINQTYLLDRLNSMYLNGITLKDLTSTTGLTIGTKAAPTTGVSRYGGSYIEFDVFFRSAAESGKTKTVRLTELVIGGTDKSWISDVPTFLDSNGDPVVGGTTVQVAAKNAARVSFTNKNLSTEAVIEVYQLAGSATNSVELPHLSYDQKLDATPDYSIGAGADDPKGAASYWLAKGNLANSITTSLVDQIPDAKQATTNDVLVTLVAPDAGNTFSGLNNAYVYGRIAVKVWIEGWDADTFDALFLTTLTVSMKFDTVTA